MKGATTVLFADDDVEGFSKNVKNDDRREEIEPCLATFDDGNDDDDEDSAVLRSFHSLALDIVVVFDLLAFFQIVVDVGTHTHAFT
jgi:hypothetical protein